MSEAIVIGGGFAGLAAGVALAADGHRVTVLEQRPHLGGRAYSYVDGTTGDTIDNGQHVLMGCYHETLRFLARLGVTDRLRVQPTPQVSMLDGERGAGVIACPSLPNPLHMVAGVLGYRLLGPTDRVRVLAGGLRLLARRRRRRAWLAERTVGEALDALGQTAATRRLFWDPLATATLNEDPRRASADLLAEVLVRAFFSGKDDARFILPRVGLSELYALPAQRFIEAHGGAVLTKVQVASLVVRDRSVEHCELRDGRRLRAAVYVSAVPPPALASMVPPALRREIRGLDPGALPASPIVSVHVWLDRPVMDDAFSGLVGTTMQWVFDRDRITGRACDRSHLAFVASGARALVDLDQAALVEMALADLRGVVPAARAAELRHAQVIREKAATISPTIAAARHRPGVVTPLSNLLIAGDWLDTGLPATIESAVRSAHEAAACAGRCLRDASGREEAKAAI